MQEMDALLRFKTRLPSDW